MRSRTPTLRELHGFTSPRAFWDDPDLAPAPRKETPLSAFCVEPATYKEAPLSAFA